MDLPLDPARHRLVDCDRASDVMQIWSRHRDHMGRAWNSPIYDEV
jgi:hypothetical protein